jgi:hypothetical protein
MDSDGPLDDRRYGHNRLLGLSWLARYTARVLALFALYRRIGTFPATLLR